MSDLRIAAQQALEALIGDQDLMVETAEKHWEYKTDLAIAALRAALTQQATGSWRDGVLEGQLRERERWLAQQPEPAQEILTQKEINDLTDVHLTADIDTPVGEDEPVAWVEGAEEFARAVESAVLRKLRRQPEPVACSVNRLHIEAHRLIVDRLIAGEDYDTVLTDMGLSDTPPQRPPLTDAEMLDIIDDAFEGSSLLDVARAIERKVRGE